MSQASAHDQAHGSSGAGAGHGHAGPHHGPAYYVKIWGILCVLLVISLIGPEIGIKIVTLITAFGIAIVKAWMVCAYFMHLNIEKKYVSMLLAVMIGVLLVFYYGIAPDVQKHEGTNWENKASQEHIQKELEADAKESDGHH